MAGLLSLAYGAIMVIVAVVGMVGIVAVTDTAQETAGGYGSESTAAAVVLFVLALAATLMV